MQFCLFDIDTERQGEIQKTNTPNYQESGRSRSDRLRNDRSPFTSAPATSHGHLGIVRKKCVVLRVTHTHPFQYDGIRAHHTHSRRCVVPDQRGHRACGLIQTSCCLSVPTTTIIRKKEWNPPFESARVAHSYVTHKIVTSMNHPSSSSCMSSIK